MNLAVGCSGESRCCGSKDQASQGPVTMSGVFLRLVLGYKGMS